VNYRIVNSGEAIIVPEECLVADETNALFLQNIRLAETVIDSLKLPPFTLIMKEEQ